MAKKMETGSSRIDTLRDRLVEMASMMGEEELEHLVDQAESWVQARKLQVERRALGETLERLGTGQRVNAPKGKAEPSVEVVENPSGQSFIIVMNNERTFMPLDEMRRLVLRRRSIRLFQSRLRTVDAATSGTTSACTKPRML